MIHLIVGLVVSAVLAFFLRSASRAASTEGTRRVLRYGPAWRWLVGALWVVPIGFSVLALLLPTKPEERWIPLALAGGFAALLAALTLEVVRRRIELTPDAMVAHSPWRAPLRMSWPEIAAVDWRAAANVLEIRNRVGRRVRVSPWLSGIPSLAAELEQRAPGAVGLGEALGAMRSFASTRSQ